MEWIIAEGNPPKDLKNILCSGVDGGIYKPSSVIVNDEGEVFAIVSGQKRLVYAYFNYPNAPKKQKIRENKMKDKKPRKRRANSLQWPLNMFVDIDAEELRGCIFLNEIPDKWDNKWDEISKKLSEREKIFLEMYYRELKTLREISVISDLTVERVRQILGKATRKLKNPNILAFFLKNESDKNSKNNVWQNSELLEQDILWCDPQLSVRAFNALKRNGINTKRELLLLPNEEVKKLRNVGNTTEKEIAECKNNIAIQVGLKKPIICDKIVP